MENRTFLTDADFEQIVNHLYKGYSNDGGYQAIDFNPDDDDNKATIADIEECLRDFVADVWCDDFGWKYGERSIVDRFFTAREIAKAIAEKFASQV